MDPDPPVTVLDLPPDMLVRVFQNLDWQDLVKARATCRLFFTVGSASQLWQRHAAVRWSSWTPIRWRDLKEKVAWLEIYRRRVQLEKDAAQLVANMAWPVKKPDCILRLDELGEEGLEYLNRPIPPGFQTIGQRHWTNEVLGRLQSARCAEEMRLLLARPDYTKAHIEAGALLLAQLAYPGADMAPISAYLDRLAAELRRRMAAADVSGGRPALELLNELLFAPLSAEEEANRLTDPAISEPPDDSWRWRAELAEHLVVPEQGYGLALKGNTSSYYDDSNSLLPWVLCFKQGIPISLAVIHAAVGRRAGLPIDMVSVPMHFMNKIGAFETGDELFIDVFEGGRISSRHDTIRHMQLLGVNLTPAQLGGASPGAIYARMCANLVNIYRQQHDFGALRQVVDMLVAINPANHQDRLLRAQVEMEQGDWEAATADLRLMISPPPGTPAPPLQLATNAALLMTTAAQLQADRDADAQKQFHRSDEAVKHRIGQVIQHKRYHYRGVIYGWDPVCTASQEWVDQMGVARLPKGSDQPFYNVLVDVNDRPGQNTYVAQENIETAQHAALRHQQGASQAQQAQHQVTAGVNPSLSLEVDHPQIGEFFDAFEPHNVRYRPNAYMRFRYPDD